MTTAVQIGNDRFRVALDGPDDAPVVVLSNSLGASLEMWDAQVPALARHFRVVRYDTRGHGGSERTPGPYSISQLGTDVLGILDALHIEKANFIGLSLGGCIGQWLLEHAPERIGRAVLSNTTAHYKDTAAWNGRIATVREHGVAGIANGTMERWFSPAFREADPDAVDRIKSMFMMTPAEGYIGCAAALRDLDLREGLRHVRNEVLVIVGENDTGTPPELGWAIANSIPGAQLVTLGAAHLSNVEMSDGFSEAVVSFLTAPARRATASPTAPRRSVDRKPIAARRRGRPTGTSATTATAPLAKAAPRKTSASKAPVKKSSATKSPAKKAAPQKAVAAKSTAKKPSTGKAIAKKAAAKKGVKGKNASRKAAAERTATRKAAIKKAAVKKTPAKKAVAKKVAAKSSAAKAAPRKAAAKKTTTRKPSKASAASKRSAAKKAKRKG